MIITLLLLAAALALPAPDVRARLPVAGETPKNPRDGPPRGRVDRLAVAADIDLFAACTTAGLSTATAAGAVATTGEAATAGLWRPVAALSAIGVPADRAWAGMAEVDGLAEVAVLARMSQRSGSAVAEGCRRLATTLRADAADDATARAERAGVLIALPLALCFLPAFFTLGLAPVVISLGTDLLSN